MLTLDGPSLVLAFVITIVEMTEVVALVFAFAAEHHTVRDGALGAVAGTATVALVAVAFGAAIIALPRDALLWASAFVLAAFGVFLFRSTLRTYRKARLGGSHAPSAKSGKASAAQFGGGFTVGAIEAVETVIVLIALAAHGEGSSAIVGSLVAGAVLVGAALIVHERIRKIKVPLLKLGATSMLVSFAVFWGGEAAGVAWPYADLFLLPLFLLSVGVVRGAVALGLSFPKPSGNKV
ncbi:MAG: hypothetical protein ACHQ2Y_07720 [Candidatus Lutacidiplasmatales archaeon]